MTSKCFQNAVYIRAMKFTYTSSSSDKQKCHPVDLHTGFEKSTKECLRCYSHIYIFLEIKMACAFFCCWFIYFCYFEHYSTCPLVPSCSREDFKPGELSVKAIKFTCLFIPLEELFLWWGCPSINWGCKGPFKEVPR